ncbi:MAG: PilZ domain-containing protein [Planctomycetota bacterium]
MSAQPTSHLRLVETGLDRLEGRGPFRIERRGCPRYEAKGAATGMISSDRGTSIFGVALVDSSASGLRIVTDRQPQLGDIVSVHFEGSPVAGRVGRVVRCRDMHAVDGLPAFDVALDCGQAGPSFAA